MKKILALILALSMVLTGGLVFAEGETGLAPIIVVEDQEGNVLYEGAYDAGVLEEYPDGKTYTITGDVKDEIVFEPSGAMLTVNGEVAGQLRMEGGENAATVNGNVGSEKTAMGIATPNYYDKETESMITNTSSVFATGDVTSAIIGIHAGGESAVVAAGTVESGMEASYEDPDGSKTTYHIGSGVQAEDDSLVIVGKNVKGYSEGVLAEDNAHIEVLGNVNGGYADKTVFPGGTEKIEYKGQAIKATGSGKVEVSGDANSVNDGIVTPDTTTVDLETYEDIPIPNESVITVDGDVAAGHGHGIVAESEADITVGGNVMSNKTAITATGDAYISVGGNVVSENDKGISTEDQAHVTVAGDLESDGHAIQATGKSSVSVVGGVYTAEGEGIQAFEDSTVSAGYVEAYSIGVDTDDNAVVEVDGAVYAGHDFDTDNPVGSGIFANGKSTVFVGGEVESANYGVVALNDYVYGDSEEVRPNRSETTVMADVSAVHGTGVVVEGYASVTVGGDVNGKTYGVISRNETTVNVDGAVNAGYAITVEGEDGEDETRYVGTAILASGNSVVTVSQNVNGSDRGIRMTQGSAYDEEKGTWYWPLTTAVVTVEGDVTAEGGTGINVTGKSGVAVLGDVTANEGISAKPCTYTDPETGELEYIEDESTVFVGGNVSAEDEEAISTYGKTEINVCGNVSSEKDSAIEMGSNASIRIGGDVYNSETEKKEDKEAAEDEEADDEELTAYEKAVKEAKEKVFADFEFGDIRDGVVEISAPAAGEKATGELIIEGTLSAKGDSIPLLVVMSQDISESETVELPDLPDIKIYEIKPTDGEYFQVAAQISASDVDVNWTEDGQEYAETRRLTGGYLSPEASEELVEELAKYIQYIIKVEDNKNGNIDLTGVTYDSVNDLLLAHEGDEIGVTVSAKKGYRITGVNAGDVAELIDNGDGTWTVIVKCGGGVTISATIVRKAHQADGKTIRYGHYDFDGDKTKEDLEWRCMSVSNGYARLALISGIDSIPDDFAREAFTEDEMAGILNGEITELSEYETNKYFKDGKTHPVIFVKLDKIGY